MRVFGENFARKLAKFKDGAAVSVSTLDNMTAQSFKGAVILLCATRLKRQTLTAI